MSRIKICGLFRPDDIDAVNEALPDYIGFVFAQSPRRVSAGQARRLKARLDTRICAVGVFVDAAAEEIAALYADGVIGAAQLHGGEDAAYIARLRALADMPLIKAVRVQSAAQILGAQALGCDYLLLDTYAKNVGGGSGESFDWTLIPPLQKPYFLAGGIDAGRIDKAAALRPYCIDISSGAETGGVKDRRKINALVRMARRVK